MATFGTGCRRADDRRQHKNHARSQSHETSELCYIGGAVADKESKKSTPASAVPNFDPKPVTVGGESLVDRIYPHRMKLGLAVLSGLVIWAVIAIVVHFRSADRDASTQKLGRVLELGERKIRQPDPEPTAEGDPAKTPDPNAPKPNDDTFADPHARASAMLDEIAKYDVEIAGPTFRASLLVQAGKLDEAIAEYKKAQNALGIDGVLAREGLGLAQEAKAALQKDPAERQQGFEAALATFQVMQTDDNGPRRAFALYHQGRMLELLGKSAEAKAAFEIAKQVDSAGELAQLIDARLASQGT